MKAKYWVQIDNLDNNGLPFPEEFYRAEAVDGLDNDGLFIQEQLNQLTITQRSKAAESYSLIYLENGRFEANTRLRKFVERCRSANSGKTMRPRIVK